MSDHVIFRDEQGIRDEITAAGAITPGHLVDPSGGVVHASAGENAMRCVADFDPFREAAAGVKNIDTDYASGEEVPIRFPQPGQWVYAILATSQTIADGDFLESAGDGTLQALTASAATSQAQRESVVCKAAEAVTTTTATARIWVRVL